MTRYFVIAIACLGVLAGIGFVVRDHLGAAPQAPGARDAGSAPGSLAASDAAGSPAARVVEARGTVERRSGDHWVPVAGGERLDEQDAIRTGDDSNARLELGGKVVELGDRTQITVGELSRTIGLQLAGGRVSANGGDDARILRIVVRDTDTVAESTTGSFDMLSSSGNATIAAQTGKVTLSAHGATVHLGAGEQSTVHAGAAPTPPVKIPPSLFLKVSASGGGTQTTADLHGETAPGAIVSVNGVRTMSAPDGSFASTVALKQGKNVVIVFVEDVSGRRETKTITRDVETRAPRLDTQVEWK